MRRDLHRILVAAAVMFLLVGWSPLFAQDQADRDWQDILKDVVRDAVEDGTSSNRLGRIRDVDVVNRSGSVVDLEVELQDVSDPDRVRLTVEVFGDDYSALNGFEARHDPIPEGDGTVLLQVVYLGAEDVRSVGVKVNLVDSETNGVTTRRKAPLPWEWIGGGGSQFSSTGNAMADPNNLSTRGGTGGEAERREPQVVTLDPRRVGNTPAMEQVNVTRVAAVDQSGAETAPPVRRRAPPPPPTSSSSSSSSGKQRSTKTATVNSTAAAIASGSLVMATNLDLYAMAKDAQWKSQKGSLPFNGKTNDQRGFVRALGRTELINGRTYEKVLETHPEWKDGGYISGSYDVVIPPAATRFEAKGAFLPKVTKSDGVRVSVLLRQGAKSHTLVRKTIRPGDGVVALRATVPESLRGKQATVVLHVSTGTKSTQDMFAWSEPVIR